MKTPLVCVKCRTPLAALPDFSQAAQFCTGCKILIPRLLGRMPILLPDPEAHLAATYGNVASLIRSEEARLQKVEAALANGQKREPALRRIALGMAQNLDFYRRWLRILEQTSHTPDRLTASAAFDDTGYTSVLRYLLQDWRRSPDNESAIAVIRDHVRQDLREHLREPEPIVVLGAGTGRLAHELAPHAVWALELSLPMAIGYGLLRQETLRVCDPIEANTYQIADLYPAHELRAAGMPDLAGYIVGDALQMPFADRSLSAVLSIYFSDVVPLSQLLREVTRVLRPGGAFLHFGPLGYSSYQPDEMWTVQEVRELLAAHGLRLRAERFVPHMLNPNPRRMSAVQVHAWSFVAIAER